MYMYLEFYLFLNPQSYFQHTARLCLIMLPTISNKRILYLPSLILSSFQSPHIQNLHTAIQTKNFASTLDSLLFILLQLDIFVVFSSVVSQYFVFVPLFSFQILLPSFCFTWTNKIVSIFPSQVWFTPVPELYIEFHRHRLSTHLFIDICFFFKKL